MKNEKMKLGIKIIMACFVFAIMCTVGMSSTVQANYGSKKKNETCYLNRVNAEVNGKSYVFKSGLKPFGVPADLSWEDFWRGMTITTYELVQSSDCGEGDHHIIVAYIDIEEQWRELFYYDVNTKVISYELEGYELSSAFYDVKFSFTNNASDYTSTAIYARFAREYNVNYNLDGGSFTGASVATYTTGASYKLINPVREGYKFVGWTGTGLTETTANVVIPSDASGNRLYTAVWEALPGTEVTNPGNDSTGNGETTTKETLTTTTGTATENTVGVTKVKKATKKLSLKKAKISIKGLKGSSGYQVEFSKTKKFKKVLVTKTNKTAKFTVTSKKIKNKKKLFVRVRAYKLDGTNKVFGEWSKPKRVKIK